MLVEHTTYHGKVNNPSKGRYLVLRVLVKYI